MQKITDMLFELQDTGYRDFHSKLVPGVDKERIIGVRTPALRKLAKEIAKMPEYETLWKHRIFIMRKTISTACSSALFIKIRPRRLTR